MELTTSDLRISDLETRFGVIAKTPAKCAEHGDYISVTSKRCENASGCPACSERAQKIQDQERMERERKAAARERLERKLGAAMIPPRFAGKGFDGYQVSCERQRGALKACTQYAENFPEHHKAGRCLLLVGNVGTGKTHLAGAIAQHIITEQGGMAVYRTLYGLMQYVKGSFADGATYTEIQAYENLVAPHLLIIDEIGATKQTEFEQATLFNVINGRYEQQLPTLIISNLMPKELERSLGDRVMDRLRENKGICLVFDWDSARRSA